mgnify:CR=1 FL=1
MFSKACEYGIRAVLHLASETKKGNRISVKEISNVIDSPIAFTAKILQQLSRKNIVQAIKGPNGGYELSTENYQELNIKEIVIAIDGDGIFTNCGLGLTVCDSNKPCPVHFEFDLIRKQIEQMGTNASLHKLTNKLNLGITVLKR